MPNQSIELINNCEALCEHKRLGITDFFLFRRGPRRLFEHLLASLKIGVWQAKFMRPESCTSGSVAGGKQYIFFGVEFEQKVEGWPRRYLLNDWINFCDLADDLTMFAMSFRAPPETEQLENGTMKRL